MGEGHSGVDNQELLIAGCCHHGLSKASPNPPLAPCGAYNPSCARSALGEEGWGEEGLCNPWVPNTGCRGPCGKGKPLPSKRAPYPTPTW